MRMTREEELRIHRCCIAPTRPEELCCSEAAAKRVLEAELRRAVGDGFRTFLTGMSRGVGIWAGQIVLGLRGTNLDVRLVAVSPFRGVEETWSPLWQRQYRHVIAWADAVRYISPEFDYEVFRRRNEWMIDRTNLVIAFDRGPNDAIQYARSHGAEVRNLAEQFA